MNTAPAPHPGIAQALSCYARARAAEAVASDFDHPRMGLRMLLRAQVERAMASVALHQVCTDLAGRGH